MTDVKPGPLLHELVTAQADRTPDAVAVRQWDRRLTYRELTRAANALAHRLRGHGVGPETRVGVCARRTPDLLVSVLGVLLSGGAYVPLDPSHPRERLLTIVEDAAIDLVVADPAGDRTLAGAPVVLLQPDAGAAPEPPARRTHPAGAAYVLYTSGSTGRPKGVVVSHDAVVSFVTMAGGRFELGEGCRSIGFAALGFDVSVLDIFAPLARGGAVMLVPDEDRVDPARLQRFLEGHEVTWGTIPPALLPLLDPDRLPSLADLLTAGEPAGPEQVARWARPGGRRFHNWYGPTETTVCVVGTELEGAWDRPLPIGHALPGCTAHVLDDQLDPCPAGVPGELYIGGPQLARGYLDRPGLSAERFVPDPYGPPGARLYRTGDRVVLDADGRIGFLGRLDRQVKVQGQRVEIGEIESVLRAHEGVRQAVADLDTGAGGLKELTAYLTPEDAPDLAGLRAHCLRTLPAYMVPTRVVRLPVLPMTVSGKVDMVALRAHRPSTAPARGGLPRSAEERAVAAVWAGTFESAEPRLDDDFFAAGGHSLLAMRLTAGLRVRLRREIAVEDVLSGRTVAGIAARVAGAPPLHEAPGVAPAALSAIQRRMWFVERLAQGTPVHNIAMAQRLSGRLDVGALRAALAAVARRHEVLRWRVPESGGVPAVAVDPPGEVPLPVEEVTGEQVRERLQAAAAEPFDLAGGPLWRARLLRLGGDEHVLAVTAHHIVFDGWSQSVLYDDIGRAYRGEALAPLPATFGGYVAWLGGREATADLDWWSAHLDGAPTVLDLPRDRPRPAVQTFEGASASAEADPAVSAAVRALAARLGATPYAVMLAAFAQVLRRLTGQRDLVVGTPVADRRDPALEPMAGCLVQMLPVRMRVADGEAFAAHVTRCQATLSDAFAHLDVRLERLVDRLGPGRDLSRNPLIQVLFNMYDFTEPRLSLPGITATPLPPGLPGSLFDLTLYVGERQGRHVLQAVYNPRLFRAERVEALLAGYLRLLGDLVAAPDEPVRHAALRPATIDPPDDAAVLPGGTAAPPAVLPGGASPPDGTAAPPAVLPGGVPAPPGGVRALPGGTAALPGWSGSGIVERVLRQAAAHPRRVAVSGEGGELTYAALAATVTATAARVAAAVRPGEAVAVLAARRTELPALLLGVLAAGARWAVLDSALPPARLEAQARAAGAHAMIACEGVAVPPELDRLPRLTQPAAPGARPRDELPFVPLERRGYLSFTSGTTGAPKPVRTGERPLARFLAWYPAAFELTAGDTFALLAGLAHDPLLRDAFTPLVLGARLCVPHQDHVRDPARLSAWLRDQAVTVAHLTPQLATLVAAAGTPLPDLRLAVFGGDRLTWAEVARFAKVAPRAGMVNAYGTTETPQIQAMHLITGITGTGISGTSGISGPGGDSGDPVPVGHGVDGAELLVLDAGGAPAAVGELGEVMVRSRRLADGYLDEDLTKERFTVEADGVTGRYRTGDLGRYDPDGGVVVAGREDGQVKIRGYRVELGEIEHALLAHPGVRAAVAVAVDQPGGQVTRAYAVPASAATQAGELQRHLRACLPDHAVPADLVLLPALPLTPNGKVDRAALPAPAPRPAPRRGEEPATGTERLIAGVWREILGRPRISAGENFFEIGGHSLATAQVQARLAAALGRDVPIVDLFRFPTVRALAAHLDGERRTAGPERAARRIAARQARPSSRRPYQARQENKE
ncbi:amino acid adenylation domain-containing protein [Nonomuraea sp. NPDC003754]